MGGVMGRVIMCVMMRDYVRDDAWLCAWKEILYVQVVIKKPWWGFFLPWGYVPHHPPHG